MTEIQIAEIVGRSPPVPWSDISKIPWHEPEFSHRMLTEHLRQDHDAASRRIDVIDQQVAWIEANALDKSTAQILDLGCGPGLYTARLAASGHRCVGIDFAPAAIAYAKRQSAGCEYIEGDIRSAEYGGAYDLAMLIFGELNAFPQPEAAAILDRMVAATAPSGRILLELHTLEYVEALGARAPSWFSAQTSVFSDAPHVCLHEHWWHAGAKTTTERYFVIAADNAVTTFVSTTQAYTDSDYAALLGAAGLVEVMREPTTEGVFFLLAEPKNGQR